MNLNISQAVNRLRAEGRNQLADLVLQGGPLALQVCAALQADNSGNAIPMALPAGNGGGCGCGGKCAGGSCGLNKGGCGSGSCTPIPRSPSDPNPNPPPAIPGMPGSSDSWNCQTTRLDWNQCKVQQVVGAESLPDVDLTFTAAGPLVNPSISVELPPVGISHKFSIDSIKVTVTIAPGAPAVISLGRLSLFSEFTYVDGNGTLVHAWSYAVQERPDYIKTTDGRCPCKELRIGVTAEGHVRVEFIAPGTFAAGDTVRVELWGRRECWQEPAPAIDPLHAGTCPSSEKCDHKVLTSPELGSTPIIYLTP